VQALKKEDIANAQQKHLTYQDLDILHALRGFCAFYVVIFHAKYILWSGGRQFLEVHPRASWNIWDYGSFALDMISSAGYEMVIFFFVLSGFFIRYAQLRKHRKPLAFYINRIVRIYPPYLFACLLAACGLWYIAHNIPTVLTGNTERELNTTLSLAWNELMSLDLNGVFRTLFFTQIADVYIGYNDVYWSLLPEAIFYLLVPLAFWRIRFYYVASIVFHLIGVLWADHPEMGPFGNYLFTYNFYFAVGAMLYDAAIKTPWITWFKRIPAWAIVFVCLLLFIGLLGLAVLKLKAISGLVATLLAIISISGLLAGKVARENILIRALHKLGVFSFSLYLYHFPLLILCYAGLVFFTGETVFYARYYWLAVPVVTLTAYALYWVTERASVNYFRKV
jgi:peptidoglycan/LPS O-acetylase OafA/YrhL